MPSAHQINSATTPLPETAAAATSNPAAARPGSLYRRAVLHALRGMPRGRLELQLPEGEALVLGDGAPADRPALKSGVAGSARLRVHREAFFRQCVLGGDIGFAESYLAGDWDTPDLTAVIGWFILNLEHAPTLSGSRRRGVETWGLNLLRGVNRLSHLLRPNAPAQAKRNISAHYDLSNDFFALFLDPSLMYSSAKWAHPDQTLTEAQTEKNDALCRSLCLTATDRVLEIGTGWGGWSLHAARHYGCHVTTVTISREQHELATRRVAEAGLADRIEVRFQDFRELTGTFDKIVSIEMMEALGHRYLDAFAASLDRLLKPDGLVALQFITCPDDRYAELRRGVDFIQKHIFPGSLLLSVNRVNARLSRAGRFVLHRLEDFGTDYARTLRLWREAFELRLDEVRRLGFDDRFIRKWRYYLCYCEAAFALRNISVVHTLHTRSNNLSL
jgi:cyclopropane-fatty-acyl-phospholipid synthase